MNNVYFQYYSLLIFLISTAVLIGVSRVTEAPAEERLRGLTFSTVSTDQRQQSRESWSRIDVAASGAVLVLILLAYLYFRG